MNDPVELILGIFEKVNTIPRCSKKEQRISDWLVAWARDHGLKSEQDEKLNVRIDVPGSGQAADGPIVVLQGHMDMVCEKTPTSAHDFSRDAIPLVHSGDWLKAKDTTLGADNGIAIALALGVVESGIPHPPLEILVTVDEETGLTGAQSLSDTFVTGRQLINLDSEDEGKLTIGCAGGRDTLLSLPISRAPGDGRSQYRLVVAGLEGGHSGVDIHLGRANANVLLARTLAGIAAEAQIDLFSVTGGSAHNAIPRDASAVIGVAPEDLDSVKKIVTASAESLRRTYSATDPRLDLTLEPEHRVAAEPGEMPIEPMTPRSRDTVIALLTELPHGVVRMSADVEGLVETSVNLATVKSTADAVKINTSQRSSYAARLDEIAQRVIDIARSHGASHEAVASYPPWEPDVNSSLLTRCVTTYLKLFGREPDVELVHAGLECGVIGSKYPGMEMVSMGPTVKNPHSPDEALFVPSLARLWEFFVALLASFGEPAA